ncbi:hypothetical protein BH24DEI2_BH24DEI2_01060 [soil metagenome]
MKQLWNVTTAAVLLLLLSSCGFNLGYNKPNIDLGIDPLPLGFIVDPYIPEPGERITITIPSHTLTFASRAGSIGATVEGYTIEYYDSSGNPLFPGDSVVNSQGALNVYVPAGMTCADPLPVVGNEILGCRFDSEGVRYVRGPLVTSPNGSFMPITIAYEDYKILFSGGAVGAYADFYLYGTDDLNSPFRLGPYRMSIQVPVGG